VAQISLTDQSSTNYPPEGSQPSIHADRDAVSATASRSACVHIRGLVSGFRILRSTVDCEAAGMGMTRVT